MEAAITAKDIVLYAGILLLLSEYPLITIPIIVGCTPATAKKILIAIVLVPMAALMLAVAYKSM